MKPIDLLKHPEITRCSMKELDINLPTISKQAQEMLQMATTYIVNDEEANEVIHTKTLTITDNIEIKRYAQPDPWKRVGALYVDGDLTIEGDLLNRCDSSFPILIVKGNLAVRSWLRGGMIAFIGGNIEASGVLVGEYNDGALFVGGDLVADSGFINRREPYPDLPNLKPLQIEGEIRAKTFDATKPDITNELIQNTFVTEVHYVFPEIESELWYDSEKIIKRASDGLSIWKKT